MSQVCASPLSEQAVAWPNESIGVPKPARPSLLSLANRFALLICCREGCKKAKFFATIPRVVKKRPFSNLFWGRVPKKAQPIPNMTKKPQQNGKLLSLLLNIHQRSHEKTQSSVFFPFRLGQLLPFRGPSVPEDISVCGAWNWLWGGDCPPGCRVSCNQSRGFRRVAGGSGAGGGCSFQHIAKSLRGGSRGGALKNPKEL